MKDNEYFNICWEAYEAFPTQRFYLGILEEKKPSAID